LIVERVKHGASIRAAVMRLSPPDRGPVGGRGRLACNESSKIKRSYRGERFQ